MIRGCRAPGTAPLRRPRPRPSPRRRPRLRLRLDDDDDQRRAGVEPPGGARRPTPALGLAPTGHRRWDRQHVRPRQRPRPIPSRCCSGFRTPGAPEISTRMHSCQKLKYATLGNVLTSARREHGQHRQDRHAADSAGQQYKQGRRACDGRAQLGARVRGGHRGTTTADAKLFDILVQPAPEIIAAMPNRAACMIAGVATNMFDAHGQLASKEGVSCWQCSTATAAAGGPLQLSALTRAFYAADRPGDRGRVHPGCRPCARR